MRWAIFVCAACSASLIGQCAPGPPAPLTETFESAVPGIPGTLPPGWTNVSWDDLDWRVHSGATPTTLTGPTFDHTVGAVGGGRFLYVETSTPALAGQSAVLQGPCVDIAGVSSPEVVFWFHMYGSGHNGSAGAPGGLAFEVDSGAGFVSLWSAQGERGDAWHRVRLALPPGPTLSFRFVFIVPNGNPTWRCDVALDDLEVREQPPALYQTNRPGASLTLDDVQGDPWNLAVTRTCSTEMVGIRVSSMVGAYPWDMWFQGGPIVSTASGAPTTLSGQIVNISLFDPIGGWLLGGSDPNLAIGLPPGGVFLDSFVAGSTGAGVGGQGFVIDPVNPEGVSLTQPIRLEVSTSGTIPGPVGGDGVLEVVLGAPPLCLPPMDFYGTTYTSLYVAANGRVTFGGPDPDFTPSVVEALTGFGAAGAWVDLEPQVAGTVDVASAGGVLSASWTGVPYWMAGGGTATTVDFQVRLDTSTDQVVLDGLLGIVPDPSTPTLFLGITAGGFLPATDPGPATFAPGGSGQSAVPGDMLYEIGDAGTLAPGVDVITFTPLPTGGYSWTAL